jgi:WD40 repeat protein
VDNRGKLQIWDIRTGEVVAHAPLSSSIPSQPRNEARFAPPSLGLLSNRNQNGEGGLRLWELVRPLGRTFDFGPLLAATETEARFVDALLFSPDERRLVCSVPNPSSPWVIDLERPDAAPVAFSGNAGACVFAFSPDGKQLGCVSRTGKGQRWQLPSTVAAPAVAKAGAGIAALTFNASQQPLAVVDARNALQVVNLDTGEAFAASELPPVRIRENAFSTLNRTVRLSRDGGHLVWLEKQGTGYAVKVLDLQTRSVVFTTSLPGPGQCSTLADKALRVAVGQDQQILVYDPHEGQLLAALQGHEATLADLAFDRSGQLLASAARDGTVRLWEPTTGELFVTFHTGQETLARVALSPGGRWLATGDARGRVRLWDLAEVRRNLREAGLDWSSPR